MVGEEAADVGVGCAPLLHGDDDGGEVVVEKHQVGGLAGDVGSRHTHCHADVGLAERRAVIDPVAGHREHMPPTLQGAGDGELLFGGDTTDHHAVAVE